jgi:hypothetical protein
VNGGPDVLSRRLRGDLEPEPEQQDDLEEIIETTLGGVRVEQGSYRKRRQRPYKPFASLRFVEEYKWGWKEIGELLGDLKRPEGMTAKQMKQCWRDATRYLLSAGSYEIPWLKWNSLPEAKN